MEIYRGCIVSGRSLFQKLLRFFVALLSRFAIPIGSLRFIFSDTFTVVIADS